MLKLIKKLFRIKNFEEKCRQYNLPLPTDPRWEKITRRMYPIDKSTYQFRT
jgi:hypothetical protein